MKVIISGPRRLPSRTDLRDPWPHMHIELDLPDVPAEGEHITLRAWCQDGAAKARERAELAEQHAALASRIMAELAAEREVDRHEPAGE